MLHWHGETMAPDHGIEVRSGATQSSPTSDSTIPCTACQIVQSGAAQPAYAIQVLPSSNSVALVRFITPSDYRSDFPAMSYGRAPPLV